MVGPIEGIPGTGKPIGPGPKPPIELPMPPNEGGERRKKDKGDKKDEQKEKNQTEGTQKKGTKLF